MPGFICHKIYVTRDGGRVSIHKWESTEQLSDWREQPDRVVAQRAAREKYLVSFQVKHDWAKAIDKV
jgi:heme-degrading monooxygenase HmoA